MKHLKFIIISISGFFLVFSCDGGVVRGIGSPDPGQQFFGFKERMTIFAVLITRSSLKNADFKMDTN